METESKTVRSIRWEATTAIVELEGDVDMHRTPAVHRAMVSVCDKKPQRLIVDLTDVPYMDSSGIGLLVEIFRRVNAYSGILRLCGIQERVRGVFEVTKLDKFFSIFPAQAEALAT